MMANKAGLIGGNSKYGNLFLYIDVEKLYPDVFNSNFIVNGFSEWIIHGEWNDEVITKEIQLFLKKRMQLLRLKFLKRIIYLKLMKK